MIYDTYATCMNAWNSVQGFIAISKLNFVLLKLI
jgi:hypothetical protein